MRNAQGTQKLYLKPENQSCAKHLQSIARCASPTFIWLIITQLHTLKVPLECVECILKKIM